MKPFYQIQCPGQFPAIAPLRVDSSFTEREVREDVRGGGRALQHNL